MEPTGLGSFGSEPSARRAHVEMKEELVELIETGCGFSLAGVRCGLDLIHTGMRGTPFSRFSAGF